MEMQINVLLLLIVSAVCVSSHAYGGIGGAAAKAEARAAAGALPVSIQPGAGFSGSFSKSSSSSFASSSASSSASSYSFSGSVPSGFDHKGLKSDCMTGNCPNNNDKSNSQYGSAPSSTSGAQASAVAGASSNYPNINSNCGGNGCSNDNVLPCNGEECSDNTKKCKSGQCNSLLDDGLNDINSNAAKASESKDKSAQNSKASNHADSQSIFPYPSFAGTTVSTPYSNPPTYSTTPKEPCDSPNCGSSKIVPPSSYNVPLGTILSGSSNPCTYGNCNTQGSLPSSAPVSNQYSNPGCSTPGCSVKPPTNYLQAPNYSDTSNDCNRSGTCGTATSNGIDIGPIPKIPKIPIPSNASPNTAYSSEIPRPSSNLPTSPHASFPIKTSQTTLPESDSIPSFIALNDGANVPAFHNQPTPGPHITSPSYVFGSSLPHKPSNAPVGTNIPHSAGGYPMISFSMIPSAIQMHGISQTILGSGCGGSGCGGSYTGSFQTAPSFVHNQSPCKTPGCSLQPISGAQGGSKPYYDSQKAPQYSGGFGGPPGLLKPNEFTGSSNIPTYTLKPVSEVSHVGPSFGHDNTPFVGCAHGNCNNSPGNGVSGGNPVQCQSGKCNNNIGHIGVGTSGEHTGNHNRTPVSGITGTTCPGGNCNQQVHHNGAAAASHTQGATGTAPLPCATGNCNEAQDYEGFSSGSTSPGYGGIVVVPAQCKSGNCNQDSYNKQPATIPAPIGSISSEDGAIGASLSTCATGKCNQAPNNNGFATGSTRPGYEGITVGPAQCKSGNCNPGPSNNEPVTGSNVPPHIGVLVNPNACASGKCNSEQKNQVAAAAYKPPGLGATLGNPCPSGNCNKVPSNTYGGGFGPNTISAASATSSAGAYAGGFGGPPGLLKPHDNGKLEGKDSTGKFLASLMLSGDLYSAVPSVGSDDFGSRTFHFDTYKKDKDSKNVMCNGGCGGNGSAVASAKAVAGASAIAGAKGYGGSSASSSASAHASAGAHTGGNAE